MNNYNSLSSGPIVRFRGISMTYVEPETVHLKQHESVVGVRGASLIYDEPITDHIPKDRVVGSEGAGMTYVEPETGHRPLDRVRGEEGAFITYIEPEVDYVPIGPFRGDKGAKINYIESDVDRCPNRMQILQEFALVNIHSSPYEDRQFRFELNRLTNPTMPVLRRHRLWNRESISMPDEVNRFHLYNIGRIPPSMLNLRGKCTCRCPRTGWINVGEDMSLRNYIFQMYDTRGLNFPRSHIYYQITRESHLVIAVKVDNIIKRFFNVDDYKYIRVYSNPYYRGEASGDVIKVKTFDVANSRGVNGIVRYIESMSKKGTTFYYYNGFFSDVYRHDIAKDGIIEVFHDTGVRSAEKFRLSELRTFQSKVDNTMKYFIHRDSKLEHIEYEDDLELYIVGGSNDKTKKGLYYYQNKNESLRNVTDKDYALNADYVNFHANDLANNFKFSVKDTYVYLFTRDPANRRALVYSSLKIHELYQLPQQLEKNIMLNNGFSIDDFRVETLEASNYWKVAGMLNISELTRELALDTVGYSSGSFYYGNTPNKINSANINVPYLYAHGSMAYEYDENGVLTRPYRWVRGMLYKRSHEDSKMVEFITSRGLNPRKEIEFYDVGTSVRVNNRRDYVVISAIMTEDFEFLSEWKDVTKDIDIEGNRITVPGNAVEDGVFTVVYLDELHIEDFETNFRSFTFDVTFKVWAKHKDKRKEIPIPLFYETFELFFNGHRLIEGIDYNMDYPRVVLCNKEYIDYTKEVQHYHLRASGIVLAKDQVNNREVKGFVNHGVLARNNFYDIREDRVFSAWVGGKILARDEIKFAEKDKTLRIYHEENGKPYVISDRFIPLYKIAGLQTHDSYLKAKSLNNRISKLYNNVYPEPKVNEFMTIRKKHMLFSPLVTKILLDMLTGVIPEEFYTREYHLDPIRDMIDRDYKDLLALDPIKQDLPYMLVEIQPEYGNKIMSLSVFQYRFLYNVIKAISGGNNEKINMSGYFTIDQEVNNVDYDKLFDKDLTIGLTPFD